MRLYIKLIVLVALFLGLSSQTTRGVASEVAYAARVKYVLAFGSQRDYEALVDATQRALAARGGRLDGYEAGKRFRALLAERLADAARRNVFLTDHDLVLLHAECAREAYGGLLEPHVP